MENSRHEPNNKTIFTYNSFLPSLHYPLSRVLLRRVLPDAIACSYTNFLKHAHSHKNENLIRVHRKRFRNKRGKNIVYSEGGRERKKEFHLLQGKKKEREGSYHRAHHVSSREAHVAKVRNHPQLIGLALFPVESFLFIVPFPRFIISIDRLHGRAQVREPNFTTKD